MKPKTIFSYIWIGTCLRYLQDAQSGWSIHKKNYVMDNINRFLETLEENELHVTERACAELLKIQEKLKSKTEDSKLSAEEAKNLNDIMDRVRDTFEAETQGFFAYVVTDKRMDVHKLLNNVGQLFKPNVFESLPEIARYDFKEAGLCIAFERPTAAAFHILRGTEDVLRIYYKRHIRPSRPNLTWGQIITELRNKIRGKKPGPILVNNLDNIRNSFRNPTQHPNKIYDIQEAQDLFSLCIDVINRMSSTFKA